MRVVLRRYLGTVALLAACVVAVFLVSSVGHLRWSRLPIAAALLVLCVVLGSFARWALRGRRR